MARIKRAASDGRDPSATLAAGRINQTAAQEENVMKRWSFSSTSCVTKVVAGVVAGLFAFSQISAANPPNNTKEERDRLQNAGEVMHEILQVPDDIPQDLLDNARCVIVMPSVLKAAFVVGGSYGRGTMVCRTGKGFTGPWGAPAMYAL